MDQKKLRTQVSEVRDYAASIDGKVGRAVTQLASIGETMAAIVSILGEERVVEKMNALRLDRRRKLEEQQSKGVEVLKEQGILVKGEVVTPESFIVATDFAEDGLETRVQFEMAILPPEKQAKYLGKKVGDEVTVPGSKKKLAIREVYAVNSQKVAEDVMKRVQAAAQEAEAAEAEPVKA